MKKINEKFKVKAIDMKSWESINEALKREKDPYIKAAIIILKTTGLRIRELLELTIDCSTQVDNINRFTWTDSKNGKRINSKYINNECAAAIEELKESTKEIHEQADMCNKYFLFLHSSSGLHSNEIKRMTPHQIQKLLKSFAKNNSILDTNGEPLNLTSYQFRHTFFTNQASF